MTENTKEPKIEENIVDVPEELVDDATDTIIPISDQDQVHQDPDQKSDQGNGENESVDEEKVPDENASSEVNSDITTEDQDVVDTVDDEDESSEKSVNKTEIDDQIKEYNKQGDKISVVEEGEQTNVNNAAVPESVEAVTETTILGDRIDDYNRDNYGKSNKELDEMSDNKKKKGLGKWKIPLIVIVAILVLLCAAGATFAWYYNTTAEEYDGRFLPNTYINDIDVEKMTAEEAAEKISADAVASTVKIKDENGAEYEITGNDVEMTSDTEKIDDLLASQDKMDWLSAKMGERNDHEIEISYNHDKLRELVEKLDCISGKDRVDPVNATVEKVPGEFRIVPAKSGNRADMERVFVQVNEAMENGGGEVDATETFLEPAVKDDDPKLVDTVNRLNGYLDADIVYNIDGIDDAERLTKEDIETMLVFDPETMDVSFDDEAIRNWLRGIGEEYDTVGTERSYTTPEGEVIQVSGGTFGWMTDEEAEFSKIKEDILSGMKVDRDFTYVSEAIGPKGGNEWGNTYIDIDKSEQFLRYIKDGQIVYSCDVVTGCDGTKKETTNGFWTILEKATNYRMLGEIQPDGSREYDVRTSHWLRITWSGIGIHQMVRTYNKTQWLSPSTSTHGCINCKAADAAALYDMVDYDTPVIVHL